MSLTLVGLHLALALVMFLFVLNGFMRGASKQVIGAALLVIQLGLLTAVFVTSGWLAALLALPIVFCVYGALAQLVAKPLAHKILGYRTTFDPAGSAGRDSRPTSIDEVLKWGDRKRERSARIAAKPAIASVLHKNAMGPDALDEQVGFLFKAGFGDLAWEVVSSPRDLQRLIDLRQQGLSEIEIFSELTRA